MKTIRQVKNITHEEYVTLRLKIQPGYNFTKVSIIVGVCLSILALTFDHYYKLLCLLFIAYSAIEYQIMKLKKKIAIEEYQSTDYLQKEYIIYANNKHLGVQVDGNDISCKWSDIVLYYQGGSYVCMLHDELRGLFFSIEELVENDQYKEFNELCQTRIPNINTKAGVARANQWSRQYMHNNIVTNINVKNKE